MDKKELKKIEKLKAEKLKLEIEVLKDQKKSAEAQIEAFIAMKNCQDEGRKQAQLNGLLNKITIMVSQRKDEDYNAVVNELKKTTKYSEFLNNPASMKDKKMGGNPSA